MDVVYRFTHSEDAGELATLASNVGGEVIDETEEYYPSIIVEDGELPSSVIGTNSGTVEGEDLSLIAGGHPQRPK